jgi:hypothetical protein
MIFAVGSNPKRSTVGSNDAGHLGPVAVNVREPIDDPFRR